jgi:MOB kinase activator 1
MASASPAARTVQASDAERKKVCKPASKLLPPHTGIFKLHLQANATLNSSGVYDSIKLPPGIREEDWIAGQVFGLYEEVVRAVSLLEDICDVESNTCRVMNAGRAVQYHWADNRNPEPRALSAPEYMRTLIEYAHEVLSNPNIVPIDGQPMPKCFRAAMIMLLKRFFRVYAHAYICHFREISELCGVEAHLNFCFKRFLLVVLEFNLVKREDMAPLEDLIVKFISDTARKAVDTTSTDCSELPQLLGNLGISTRCDSESKHLQQGADSAPRCGVRCCR